MEFAEFAAVCAELEATDADLAKRDLLAELFADAAAADASAAVAAKSSDGGADAGTGAGAGGRVPETGAPLDPAADGDLGLAVTAVRGTVAARWEALELGVSSSLTTRAIARATGVDEERVSALHEAEGDLGDAAARASEEAPQASLFSETLTLAGVVGTLRDLAGYEGAGSESRRVDAVAGLVSNADSPDAVRFAVRLALGHMRHGVGDGTVRDAIAAAFLAEPPTDDADRGGAADDEPADGDPDVGETGDGATADGTTAADGSTADAQPDVVPEGAVGYDEAVDAVERAFQVTNDYRLVALTARKAGVAGLRDLDVAVGRPIQVMLARKAESVDDALSSVRGDVRGEEDGSPAEDDVEDDPDPEAVPILLEYKYDGIRAQVHVDGDDVRLFTRRLADVTEQFPDVVAAVEDGVTAESALLEGEVVAYDPDTGGSVPFQRLSRRVKREEDVARLAEEVPVTLHCFDAVSVDGDTLLDRPLRERLDRLDAVLDEREGRIERAARLWTADRDEAASFYREALAADQEGVMCKNLEAAYQPGRRVGYMLKVKPVMEPLDLVVTRVQYGEGRRSEWLSRPFLACRDADSGEFREVGRLATGYTDEELAELTERLEGLVVDDGPRVMDVRPELVVEIEYEEVQESPEYGSGYALRFPRFLRIRDDLAPEDADTLDRVSSLYDEQ